MKIIVTILGALPVHTRVIFPTVRRVCDNKKAAAGITRRDFLFNYGDAPRVGYRERRMSVLGRPGDDLLFQALRLSTIGAEDFDGRVRDGIGYRLLAMTTRPAKNGTMKQAFAKRTRSPRARPADLAPHALVSL